MDIIQLFIMLLGGTMCSIIALFSFLIRYRNKKRKILLVTMELSTAVLMFANVLTHVFDKNASSFGLFITKTGNFISFFLIYVQLLCLYHYISSYLPKKDEYKTEGNVVSIYALAGFGLLVLSQFNGMFYSIDRSNTYKEGPLILLAYIIPMALSFFCFLKTVNNRNHLTPYIFIANIIFTLLPVICGLIQVVVRGTYLFEISMAVSMIVMFGLSLVNQNAYLSHIARIEQATRLYNSYGFIQKIEEKIAKNEISKYNAYYFDISRMGLINRKYGNNVGDQVIVNYAKIVKDSLRDDEVLGRLGGNFFVALVRKENTSRFLELLKGANVKFKVGELEDYVNISSVVGAYEIPDNEVKATQIMSNISMAVSLAKNVKKKPVLFLTKEIMQELTEARHTQQLFPQAAAKGEFKAYYQPKVNQTTNTLSGAEALARWIHDGEVIPPYKFIPLMEQNEFICKLDFCILENVCSDLRNWIDQGLNPPVISINFSRKNLGNKDLAAQIYEVVKKHSIPPHLIQIEITETVDEFPLSALIDVIIALEGYGMSTAIDDFGTGSSSIKLLKDVPFNVLKIDKSFIDSITKRDRTILSYIIGMAHTMGVSVITEGVETKEQIDVLTELGCFEIQGYYYDKPLEKEKFEYRIKNPIYE